MSSPITIPAWKTAPFLRLLVPLIGGILLQWYLQLQLTMIIFALAGFSISSCLFLLFPLPVRFKWRSLQGLIIQLIFMAAGALLTWQNDIRHYPLWYGKHYDPDNYIVVRIDEPLVEKNRSFKAEGYVESVIKSGKQSTCKGKILLYFSKDSLLPGLQYGDRIIIHKPLQQIRNSGNPGAFDYERHAAFQGIFHNVFLEEKDWVRTSASKHKSKFTEFLFNARDHVLTVLKENIRSGKDELGIAQALLIGYTNDLDKDLVQAYSNTGVVHIIAISGMHLALIYLLLNWVFAALPVVKRSKLLRLILVLSCLWIFSLLTGASASVLRAAVMFTCIAIGKSLKKEASVYASLAASAFLLLCYDPFYLWSVGFQLSYLAVLGILIFQRPLYNIIYIRNKWVDTVWKLTAVSIAAQLLTFPVCIYYFHQFPNLFLVTNVIAVPLSSVILYAAIALTAFSWIPFMAAWLGKFVGALTWIMNAFIQWINEFSFAVWDMIPATILSTWLLYAVIICFSSWLILRNKKYFNTGMTVLPGFVFLMTFYKWDTYQQNKIIVYNVPRHQAIDMVAGNEYRFVGDSILMQDGILQNFHLKPARISFQLLKRKDSLASIIKYEPFYMFNDKTILVIDKGFNFWPGSKKKILVDLLIVSHNPPIDIQELTRAFTCKLIVFDASNSHWKIKKWQQDCILIQQPIYIVEQSGAFVLNIGI